MDYKVEVAGLYNWLVGMAHKYYSCVEDCEDLAMFTIERMLVGESTYDGRPIKPWACGIMQNKYIDEWRRQSCVEIVRDDDVGGDPVDEEYAHVLSSVREIGKTDVGVKYAILFAEGHSYDDVARLEGITPQAVKSRIYRGRERLRKVFC